MANTYSKYEDKQDLNVDTSIPRKNKCIAEDLNFLKYQLNVDTEQDFDYSVNVIHSKNLFNKNTIIGNTKLKTDGSTEASTSGTIYCTSQYIEVYGFTKYTFSTTEIASEDVRIVEYDANKKFIKYTDHAVNEGYTITTDNDTKYIRVSMAQNIGYTNSCQIELGETKTDYENFVEDKTIMDGDIRDSVSVNTTNDERKRINFIKSRNLFNANDYKYVKAGFTTSSPNLVPNDNATTVCIPVKPNTYYSVKKNIGANLFIALSSVEPTTSSAITNNNGNALLSELNILTNADTKYLVILAHTTSIDTETLATTLNGLMVEQSYIYHDYEPYTTNSIKVDNEKYTDTLNISSEVDNTKGLNVLYSKNLFDKKIGDIQNGLWYDASNNKITSNNGGWYVVIPIESNKSYTISRKNVNDNNGLHLAVGTTTSTPTANASFVSFGDEYGANVKLVHINSGATAKYMIIYVMGVAPNLMTDTLKTLSLEEMQVEVGTIQTTYTPFITPSIVVNNETIYQAQVLLWENPSPTSAFAGQEITLSDNLSNYSYYEVLWLFASTAASIQLSTGKIEVGKLPFLGTLSTVSGALAGYRRLTDSISDTSITFGNGTRITTSGTTDNAVCIPYKVLGYK